MHWCWRRIRRATEIRWLGNIFDTAVLLVAAQTLILGGKVRALLDGRFNVSIEDVRALLSPGPASPNHPEF